MIKISAVIITFNEEKNIGRCIDSLLGLADEIVVLDSCSKDDTKKICLEKQVRFYENAFEGHIQQKNKAVSLASYDYILSLDADEYLSENLKKSIAEIKMNSSSQAYSMNRLSSFKGRWIRATDWYPDRKIRLWNKNFGRWGGNNPHDTVILAKDVTIKHLKGDLLHVAYEDIEELYQKAYAYALIYARDQQGTVTVSTFKILYKTFYSFFRNFILKLGFTYGYDGLIISFAGGIYTFYKYSLLKEHNKIRRNRNHRSEEVGYASYSEADSTTGKSTIKNLRVLHLSTEMAWRGGEQQIAYLIEELNKTDITNLLAVQKDSLFDRYCDQMGWVFHRLDFSSAFNVNTALKIKAICSREHVDLVHLHTAQAHSLGVLSAFLGSETPLILSRRVAFVPKNSFFTKWKYNHPAIKKVVCVSHKIETIMRSYLKHPEKSMTIHDGIDTQKFSAKHSGNKLRQEFNIPPDIFLIGNTSALSDSKDYYTFIDTVNTLVIKKRPVMAFIIGHGPLEMNLKMYVNKLNLSDRILFTGFRNDITEILPCLNIFLMTSIEEGLGTSVLDAFAAGVPVVSTNGGGLPEMVIHQETGMLANVKDTAALARGVEELMDNAALRNSIVQHAKEKVVTSFSKEIMAQKTATLYKQLAGLA